MKYILLAVGLGAGIALALWYPPERARPRWWQLTVAVLVTVLLVAALLPPLAGSFADAVVALRLGGQQLEAVPLLSRQELRRASGVRHPVPVLVRLSGAVEYDTLFQAWRVLAQDRQQVRATVLFTEKPSPELLRASWVVLALERLGVDTLWRVHEVVAIEPWLVLPYIPGLEERARILYFHVPMAWVGVFAYLVAVWAALQYLRRRAPEFERRAMAAAAVGTLCLVLATLTGAIWARFNWGAFWNWDPRQTTIVVLLFIYLAYFALRGSLPEGERRARLGSIYLVFAFATVPFLVFVLPRMMESLHPGGRGDVNIGPILSPEPEALNPVKQVLFALSLLAFTALFGWLWSLMVRLMQLMERVQLQAVQHGVFGKAR
jgi:heme exporter protein C